MADVKATGPTCGHCGGPLRGYATVNGVPLCHPDEGLDCYRLVTVYGHLTGDGDCPYFDNPGWVRNERARPAEAAS